MGHKKKSPIINTYGWDNEVKTTWEEVCTSSKCDGHILYFAMNVARKYLTGAVCLLSMKRFTRLLT